MPVSFCISVVICNAHLQIEIGSKIKILNLSGGILGTAATTGLLYQPRIIGDSDCREIGGTKIGRGAEVLGGNLSQRHFVQIESTLSSLNKNVTG
jgi:hypothetical protein